MGEYALIYDFLKISPSYAKNLYEALKLLAQHHTDLLKYKMIGKHKFISPPHKRMTKASSADKLYSGLVGKGKDYYLVKDSYLKADQVLQNQNKFLD